MPIRLWDLSWQIKLKWQELYQQPDPMYNIVNYTCGSSPWRQKSAAFVTLSVHKTYDSNNFKWKDNMQY